MIEVGRSEISGAGTRPEEHHVFHAGQIRPRLRKESRPAVIVPSPSCPSAAEHTASGADIVSGSARTRAQAKRTEGWKMNRTYLKNDFSKTGTVFSGKKLFFHRRPDFSRFAEMAFFASKFKFAWYIVYILFQKKKKKKK